MIVVSPRLRAQARRLLDEARVIAEAPAARAADVRAAAKRAKPGQAHARNRSSSHGDSAPPPGTFGFHASTLDAVGDRFNRAIANDSDQELAAAIAWARDELDALKRGPVDRYIESTQQFEARVIEEYEGLTAPEVVRREGNTTSVTTVRNIRIKHQCEPRLGKPLVPKAKRSDTYDPMKRFR